MVRQGFCALAHDAAAWAALAELRETAERARPRLALLGDYNSGKSSLAKRLLLERGQPIPSDLTVGANPTTDRPYLYAWDGWDLIDLPGFQSTRDSHTPIARAATPDAHAVLYVFGSSLMVGDDSHLRSILTGDRQRGYAPKLDRTLFVINRCDELGPSPEDDPRAFARLLDRKRAELRDSLASRGIAVSVDRILCLAADPYGLVANRADADRSHFDPFRSWDGVAQLMEALGRLRKRLSATAADRALLEGGPARLGQLAERAAEDRTALDRRLAKQRHLATELRSARGGGADQGGADGTRLAHRR